MEIVANTYITGEPTIAERIVYELKSQGLFDQFRKECFDDVDTKPAYQNLRQRVEGNVAKFLNDQKWKPDMNKNQVREILRKNINESGYLETGVERIVDQVVNPKISSAFVPKVEELVCCYLGIEKPEKRPEEIEGEKKEVPEMELEALTPEPVGVKTGDHLDSDEKIEEEESPPFEPLDEPHPQQGFTANERSGDSRASIVQTPTLTSSTTRLADANKLSVGENLVKKYKIPKKSDTIEDKEKKNKRSDSYSSVKGKSTSSSKERAKKDSKDSKTDKYVKPREKESKDRKDRDKEKDIKKQSSSKHSSRDKERDRDKDKRERSKNDKDRDKNSRERKEKEKNRDKSHSKASGEKSETDKPDEKDKDKIKDKNDKDRKERAKNGRSSSSNSQTKSRDSSKSKGSTVNELAASMRSLSVVLAVKPSTSGTTKNVSRSCSSSLKNSKKEKVGKDKEKIKNKEKDLDRDYDKEKGKDKDKDPDKNKGKEKAKGKEKIQDTEKDKEKNKGKDKEQDKEKNKDKEKDKGKEKDKDRERGKRKRRKEDDHYSAKGKRQYRRSTDRDSNDGSATQGSSGSLDGNTTTQQSQKTKRSANTTSQSQSSGTTNGSKQCDVEEIFQVQQLGLGENRIKVTKPNFASNAEEAMRLRKIRKRLRRLESRIELRFASVDFKIIDINKTKCNGVSVETEKNRKEKGNTEIVPNDEETEGTTLLDGNAEENSEETETIRKQKENTGIDLNDEENEKTTSGDKSVEKDIEKVGPKIEEDLENVPEEVEDVPVNKNDEEKLYQPNKEVLAVLEDFASDESSDEAPEQGPMTTVVDVHVAEFEWNAQDVPSTEERITPENKQKSVQVAEDIEAIKETNQVTGSPALKYFEPVDINKIGFLSFVNNYIENFNAYIAKKDDEKTPSLPRVARKRKSEEVENNNNENEDNHDEDIIKSAKKRKAQPKKTRTVSTSSRQRYSSDDLYKPRVSFKRRRAKNSNK